MSHRPTSEYDVSPGSEETETTQATLLQSLSPTFQLGCQAEVQCPRCRDRRRDARCRKWIEECAKACVTKQENRGRDRTQRADTKRDGDEEEDENEDAGEDGSSWWLQYSSPGTRSITQSVSLSSDPPRARQAEALSLQWPYHLEVVLDVSAGLALLLLLGEEDSEMLLPPLFVFLLYLLLTMPLATVLGRRRQRPNRQL